MFEIKIIPNHTGNPPGRLAEAEIHFTFTIGEAGLLENETDRPTDELLTGMKLIGFAVWERRGGGGRNVTFPARSYSVNGERRSFALLRPVVDTNSQLRVRDAILAAYERWEADQKEAASVEAGERATGTQ